MDNQLLEELTRKVGGRFKLTVLLQKRMQELLRGSPKLIDNDITNPMEIALRELAEGRIQLQLPPSANEQPEPPMSVS